MIAEQPATGILKQNDWGDSKTYTIQCDCGNAECSHHVWIEMEAESHEVSVTLYATHTTNFWEEPFKKHYDSEYEYPVRASWAFKNIVNGLYRRLKLTWALWVHGKIELQTSLHMSEQAAFNYAATLKQASEEVKNLRANMVKK